MSRSSAVLDAEPALLVFADHHFEPLPSGALFWRSRSTLLVADLHFDKMASFARRGQMLPPYDTAMTLSRLETDLLLTGAETLISLGDTFHRADSSNLLAPADLERISAIAASHECFWIAGNHDPVSHSIGGECLEGLEIDGLVLVHEPSKDGKGQVSGHLHPAARISMNGRSVRKPCFVHDGRQLILPAYGSSTGSINILSEPFAGLFHLPDLEVTMLGRDRTYQVPAKRLVAG